MINVELDILRIEPTLSGFNWYPNCDHCFYNPIKKIEVSTLTLRTVITTPPIGGWLIDHSSMCLSEL